MFNKKKIEEIEASIKNLSNKISELQSQSDQKSEELQSQSDQKSEELQSQSDQISELQAQFDEMNRLFYDNPPSLNFFQFQPPRAIRDNVKGYCLDCLFPILHNVWLD